MPQLVRTFDYSRVPIALQFANDNTRRRAIMGPVGSGKSSACIVEIVNRALAQKPGQDGIRRTKWVVVRNTYRQLEDTTMATFFEWFPPGAFGTYHAQSATYHMRIGNAQFDVLFRAIDRPDQLGMLLSLPITGGFINEAREIAWPIIDAIDQRCGRYPSMAEEDGGGPTWYGLWMDTNPPDEESDFYRVFEVDRPNGWKLFKQPPAMNYTFGKDGKLLLDGINPAAENIAGLPPRYYEDMIQGKPEHFTKVFVLNQYGVSVDGKVVFPEYRDAIHFNPDLKYQPGHPIFIGIDFGLTPACIFVQRDSKGHFSVFDELVTEHGAIMGIDRFSDLLLMKLRADYPDSEVSYWGDPAGQQRTQGDERSCFDIMKGKDMMIRAASTQSPQLRQEAVRKLLEMSPDGKPALQVGPKAKRYRKGFMSGYHFRRIRTSFNTFSDEPEKNEFSHVHDGGQYLFVELVGPLLRGYGRVNGNLIETNKPRDIDGLPF